MTRPDQAYFDLFAEIDGATFIETGTYVGGGVGAALAAGFKRVHSVEAVEEYYRRCSEKYRNEIAAGSVVLHHGGSEAVLPRLLPSIPGPRVFWFDAHFQADARFQASQPVSDCPLAAEVEALCRSGPHPSDVVLIDDVRLLVDPKAWRGHAVDFEAVIGKLVRAYPGHFTCFVAGKRARDVFCVVPELLAPVFIAIGRGEQAASRQPSALSSVRRLLWWSKQD
jgi:hypothetical protein